MYMLKSVVSIALFAAYAVAQGQIAFTSVPTAVQAGQSYTLEWTGGDTTQPVTILLREGDPNNLQTVGTLTTTGTGGSFVWNVDPAIADSATYAFEIQQGTSNNYSGQFAVSGGTGTLTTATGTATTTGTSATDSSTGSVTATSTSESASESASSTSASESSSTASSSTLSSSASRTSATAASTSAPSNSANGLQSPIALILGAVAAMLSFA